MLIDWIRYVIQSKFIQPIWQGTGYNVVNTATYAIILVLALFFVLKILKWLQLEIDRYFLFAVSPFILFGSATRALVDAGIYPYCYWLVSPGIYLIVFFLCLATLLFGVGLRNYRRTPYYWPVFGVGVAFLIYDLVKLVPLVSRIMAFFQIVIVGGIVIGSVYVGVRFLKIPHIKTRENFTILGVHLFDGTATFVGVDFYGYVEQHVLPQFLISKVGTASVMLPLKLVVIGLVLYLIDEFLKEEEKMLRGILKLTILILGLAPALRDTLRIMIGA